MAKEVHGAAIEIIQTWVRISVFLFLHITICCVLPQQKISTSPLMLWKGYQSSYKQLLAIQPKTHAVAALKLCSLHFVLTTSSAVDH